MLLTLSVPGFLINAPKIARNDVHSHAIKRITLGSTIVPICMFVLCQKTKKCTINLVGY